MGMPLKIHRAFSQTTQLALAKKSNMSQSMIYLIENGHRIPSENQKNRIAAALNVTIEDIDWFEKSPAESNRNGAT
jgi:transcriptional regulator with XRE-family HTH domain